MNVPWGDHSLSEIGCDRAMEATGASDVRVQRAVYQIEVEEEPSSRPEQMMQADSLMKSLSPLINTMRAFGLYFIREPHFVVPKMTSQPVCRGIRGCSNWNAGRTYATIMLVVMWLNTIQLVIVFNGKETLGAVLFAKIAILPGALLVAVLRTAYYVASYTGSLCQVFSQGDLSTAELSVKYGRRAKVMMVVCWILITPGVISEAYMLYAYETNPRWLLHLIRTSPMPKICFNIINVVFVVLYLVGTVSWAFPQAMNCLVMTFLYDQFNKLSEEFSKCISDQGEFRGNFEHFRRRHQAISRSVQEADCFLMISNVAAFCCQIVTIILVLYSAIFFRHETISLSSLTAFTYSYWLAISIFVLALAAGLPIFVNHAVSLYCINDFYGCIVLQTCCMATPLVALSHLK